MCCKILRWPFEQSARLIQATQYFNIFFKVVQGSLLPTLFILHTWIRSGLIYQNYHFQITNFYFYLTSWCAEHHFIFDPLPLQISSVASLTREQKIKPGYSVIEPWRQGLLNNYAQIRMIWQVREHITFTLAFRKDYGLKIIFVII
jgi:hypothetical protein